MKQFNFCSFFVFFVSFSSIKSAPVGVPKDLYETISSDKRFEKLVKEKFILECKTLTPICVALIDVTLGINEAHMNFSKVENQDYDDFCDTKLLKVLPDVPKMSETSELMKQYNLTWFKDMNKTNDGKVCNEQCTYFSYEVYGRKVKPVCVFIYEQYMMLENSGNGIRNESVIQTKVPDQQNQTASIQSEAGTIVNVVEAKKSATTENITVPKTKPENQVKSTVNETKKVENQPQVTQSVVAVANKSITAQLKTDTKTTNINLDEQQSSIPDNPIFDQTPGAVDADENFNFEDAGVNGDDEEDAFSDLDLNQRDNNINGNKFHQDPLTDIEPHDSDNPQKVHTAPFEEDPDSNFFTYLCIIMFITIVLYILYHNRQKLLALLLEGRQGRNSRRPRSRNGSKAAYSKLDCNLEEAITSKKSLSGKSMDIIY